MSEEKETPTVDAAGVPEGVHDTVKAEQNEDADSVSNVVTLPQPHIPEPGSVDDLGSSIYAEVMKQTTGGAPQMHREVLEDMLTRTFWSAKEKRLSTFGPSETLVHFSAAQALVMLEKAHGVLFDRYELRKHIEANKTPNSSTRVIEDRTLKRVNDLIAEHIQFWNQRDSAVMLTDMFADRGAVLFTDEEVQVVFAHRPFKPANPDPRLASEVAADFREHFPMLDEFIDLLAAARFAEDRKRAYLWMHCVSDWGKTLLLSALSNLGLVGELNVREITKAFEGDPVGVQPEAFTRAWVMAVDEFKMVNAEIKQVQNSLSLAPKNRMRVEVPLYLKLFTSAEDVASLAGDHGVDDQFANRFSYYRGEGIVSERGVFKQVGAKAYREGLESYVARSLNEAVRYYRDLGEVGGAEEAQQALDEFHTQHGIGREFERYSVSMADTAREFVAWVVEKARAALGGVGCPPDVAEALKGNIIRHGQGGFILRSPGKVLRLFLKYKVDDAEQAAVRKNRSDLYAKSSADGKGYSTHKAVTGKAVKGLRLEITPGEGAMLERVVG